MKKGVLIFFSFLSFFKTFSQDIQTFDYELLGALVLESKQLISYKIQFNANKDGFIEGYSYTDLSGENETKSYIRGYYNSKKNDIQFKESDILYTKSTFLSSEFCFVNFKGKFRGNSNKKLLEGEFIGIYDDRDTCATGKIKLASIKFVEKKVQKAYKKIKKIKRVDSIVKEKIKPENYLKKFSETQIKPDEKVTVFVYSSKIKMEIWDYGKEDGDEITILQNNIPILPNYVVTKSKKKLYIDLVEGENFIKIITTNAGEIETNTTKLKLYAFRREYEIVSNLKEGESAIINIVKVNIPSKK